jgi:hypothetical protein
MNCLSIYNISETGIKYSCCFGLINAIMLVDSKLFTRERERERERERPRDRETERDYIYSILSIFSDYFFKKKSEGRLIRLRRL